MANLNRRVAALEDWTFAKTERRVMVVSFKNVHHVERYHCNGKTICRLNGESDSAFFTRASASLGDAGLTVLWADGPDSDPNSPTEERDE